MKAMIFQHIVRKVGLVVLVIFILSTIVLSASVFRQTAHAASAVTINGATTFQTIDGFGAAEAFGPAQSLESLPAGPQKQILDLLYSPTTGAGLTILRNLFPSDPSHTIEPNSPGSPGAAPTYTWDDNSWGQVWMAQQAKTYGVNQFYGDAWSAPGFMKTNNDEANGGTLCGAPGATACSTGDWRQAYANYLVQYIKDYQSDGITLSEVGAFNELNFTATYSSMLMTPAQAADFIAILGTTVKAAGLSPQIVCCDGLGWDSVQSYANGITSNATANADTSIISSHGYSAPPNAVVTGIGSKHVWESEWAKFDATDSTWDDGSDGSGLYWAQQIYTGMTSANLSAFLYWWGVNFNATDNGFLVNDNNGAIQVSPRLWTFANYSRYVRPGAVRIGASTGDANLELSAYKNTNGTVSIVVLNAANSAITASYALQNTGVADGTTVTPYLTNGSNNTAAQATTSVSGGAFSATIPARSLVTYVLSGSSVGVTPTPTVGTTPVATPTQGVTPTPTPTQTSGASCQVHYAITSQWQTGFTGSLNITNTGTTAINGWNLQFSFPNGQTITQLWNGNFTQSGSAVSITNLSYNGSIAPGASVSSEPGFNGTWTGSNSPPTAFTLNGAACSVV